MIKTDGLEARNGSYSSQGEKAAFVKELREKGYRLKHLFKGNGHR